jgi:hypothetical protein
MGRPQASASFLKIRQFFLIKTRVIFQDLPNPEAEVSIKSTPIALLRRGRGPLRVWTPLDANPLAHGTGPSFALLKESRRSVKTKEKHSMKAQTWTLGLLGLVAGSAFAATTGQINLSGTV